MEPAFKAQPEGTFSGGRVSVWENGKALEVAAPQNELGAAELHT